MIPAIALASPAASSAAPAAASQDSSIWTATNARPTASADLHPSAYKAYTLDTSALAARLDKAPSEDVAGAAGTRVAVPAPSGELVAFDLVRTELMEPGLAAKHPEIETYAGKAVGSGASIVIDVSPWGFHAAVRGSGASWFVDPAAVNDTGLYLSYRGSDLPEPEQPFVEPELDEKTVTAVTDLGEQPDQAVTRRTYRLALLTDPSYAEYVAPSLNDGAHDAESNSAVLAAKTTLMNRVNQIYTNDLAVRMVLIGDTDKLNLNTVEKASGANGPCGLQSCYVPRGTGTDPNSSSLEWGCDSPQLTRTRQVVGLLVGARNFDIGHLGLGINGGGIASLGVVGGTNKAQGCTGLPQPIGDFYAIDYVAHEMGHQFSGNHTFNGNQVNCSSTNRNAGTSVEPGSGSSVMAYAGICRNDDLQPHTDPYFSQRSQQEITAYTTSTPANVNEVQAVSFTGFDGTDSFQLQFGATSTITITRGTNYTAAAIAAAITTVTGATVTVNPFFATTGTALTDAGFNITYSGALVGTDVINPTLVPTGFSGFVNDVAKGGPPTNGGAQDQPVVNHAPAVEAPAGKFIPTRTPFTLTGSGTDSDGDSLIYLWEQNDVGATGAANGTGLTTQPKLNGPLFRVFGKYADVTDAGTLLSPSPGENLATTSPSRTFPDLDQILAGNTNAATGSCPVPVATDYENDTPIVVAGGANVANTLKNGPVLECYSEFLPTSAYTGTAAASNTEPSLNFRLTARDQNPVAGGYQYADTKLRIDKTAGPFLATSQATAASYAAGSSQAVTWDVNNTNKPTLAQNVKISLSTDGGLTFPTVLAASTPNDGTENVTMPYVSTTTGRIKIEAVGNYFFDITDAPITITRSFAVNDAVADDVDVQYSDPVNVSFTTSSDFGDVSATVDGTTPLPAGLTLTRTGFTAGAQPSTPSFSLAGNVTAPLGDYPVKIDVTDGTNTQSVEFTLHVLAEAATATYTGPTTAQAPHGGNDVTNVPLSAHVVQAADGTLGDLTNATVTIRDTTANEVLCADLPVNAGGDASCTYSADLPFNSGRTYALALTVGGRYAGSGSGALTVSIDATAPDTTITSGPAEGSYLLGSAATFGFSSSEATATFACTFDGAPKSCPSSPVSISGLSAATHRFTVAATDQAGNADTTPAVRVFTVPLDDAVLSATGKWKRASEGSAYAGTIVKSKKKGDALTTTVTGATSLALIVGTNKKFGKVKVYLDGKLIKTVSLKGAKASKVLVPVAAFATPQSGVVKIVNAKNKAVVIDGLGVVTAP